MVSSQNTSKEQCFKPQKKKWTSSCDESGMWGIKRALHSIKRAKRGSLKKTPHILQQAATKRKNGVLYCIKSALHVTKRSILFDKEQNTQS